MSIAAKCTCGKATYYCIGGEGCHNTPRYESIFQNELSPNDVPVKISMDDKINSILRISLRFLSEEELIVLRDALIERTPKVNLKNT